MSSPVVDLVRIGRSASGLDGLQVAAVAAEPLRVHRHVRNPRLAVQLRRRRDLDRVGLGVREDGFSVALELELGADGMPLPRAAGERTVVGLAARLALPGAAVERGLAQADAADAA